MTQRHWIGEAQAAFDQALGQIEGFGTPEIWLQRAQAAATLASAEQARIANLIAWKALRQATSTSTSTLPNAGDAIADEIEASLGILEQPAGDVATAVREVLAMLHGRDLSTTEGYLLAVDVLERIASLIGYPEQPAGDA